jgi:two-component system, OmpR family, KDP operon response regulator KdpE
MSASRQGTTRSIRASAIRERELTGPWVLLLGEATTNMSLPEALLAEGYGVSEIAADERLPPWIGSGPDLVLLDLRAGDHVASDLCDRLRQRSDAPTVVLAADADESAIVRAVDSGADHYVTPPCGIAEILARTRAALRRRHADRSGSEVIEHGSVRIDPGRHEVRVGRDVVHLTPTEYDLLLYLARHAGRILTRAMLLRAD